jgi:hypothetical protein
MKMVELFKLKTMHHNIIAIDVLHLVYNVIFSVSARRLRTEVIVALVTYGGDINILNNVSTCILYVTQVLVRVYNNHSDSHINVSETDLIKISSF